MSVEVNGVSSGDVALEVRQVLAIDDEVHVAAVVGVVDDGVVGDVEVRFVLRVQHRWSGVVQEEWRVGQVPAESSMAGDGGDVGVESELAEVVLELGDIPAQDWLEALERLIGALGTVVLLMRCGSCCARSVVAYHASTFVVLTDSATSIGNACADPVVAIDRWL